jgi:hypothetical protein
LTSFYKIGSLLKVFFIVLSPIFQYTTGLRTFIGEYLGHII